MHSTCGFTTARTDRIAATIAAITSLLAASAGAESVATVNGIDISAAVLEVYVRSRTQRPLSELDKAERDGLVAELKDIYVLSTQPESVDLTKDRMIAAQIELQERAIVAQAVATRFLERHQATEDEINAEYALQAKLTPPLQFRARHILLSTQGEAMDVITLLDKGGDFATLATERSTGPSAKDGGALPWFSPNQMVKPFSDAVASLEDGKYTAKPVQTEFGWHVILREESRANEPPPLESVRDAIEQNVAQKKFQAHLEMLRADAKLRE